MLMLLHTRTGLPIEHFRFEYNYTGWIDQGYMGVAFGTTVVLPLEYEAAEADWNATFVDLLYPEDTSPDYTSPDYASPENPSPAPALDALRMHPLYATFSVSSVRTAVHDWGHQSELLEQGYWEEYLAVTHIVSSTIYFPEAGMAHINDLSMAFINATAGFAGESPSHPVCFPSVQFASPREK